MPRVPTYDSFQQSPESLPNVRVQGGDAMQFSSVAGAQQQQFGKALMALGNQMAGIATAEQESINRTQASEIDTNFTAAINARQFDPNAGYMTQSGKAAVDGYQGAVDDIRKLRDEAIANTKNPQVRELVAHATAVRAESALRSISIHAAEQNKSWQFTTSQARADTTLQAAANDYTNADGFQTAIGAAHAEAEQQGRLKGWDESVVRELKQKYADSAYRQRYEAWRLADPVGAFSDFTANAGSISPLTRGQIANSLFHHAAPELAARINAMGGPGIVAGPDGNTGPQPRGVRNNNPGNVMRGETRWQGEVDGNDPRYASFETPEAGIRAMGRTLLTYQDKHNLNTVRDIVARWAPATENNTAAYIGTVAKAVGVAPDQAIDLHDPATLTKITKAIISHENGQQPYTDAQVAAGLAAARGGELPKGAGKATAHRDPSMTTGDALVDSLPSDWKAQVFNLARTQASQEMAVAREQLKGKVQDAQAAYLTTGSAPNPPGEAEFLRAYGQAEGADRYRAFRDVATLGQNIQQVKTLPQESLEQLRTQAKPTPGDGFAEKQRNYEILTKAIDQVQQARQKDPVAYAMATGAYGIQPFKNTNDLPGMARQLAIRASAAQRMAADYGTQPALLTEGEQRALGSAIKAAPVEQQKTYLATMYQGIGDMTLFKRTMQTIAPDNPTVAVAGIYQAKGLRSTAGQDVADLILRGQAILTPNTKEDGKAHLGSGKALLPMPEEKLLLSEWNSATGDAFKGKEQAADLFQQTARAIYAARSAEEGDYSGVINTKRWRSAINLATGGIAEHNGSQIVMPYGMALDTFRDQLKARTETLAKDGNAVAATARDLQRLPLENVGDGRYLFRRGTGYVVTRNGTPLVLDLNGATPSSRTASGVIRR